MKTMQSLLAAAALLAAFASSAAPQPLGNPLRAAKGCQSLSAQETARCKKTEDYCTNKPKDPKCMRFNKLREKYPLEQRNASAPESSVDYIVPAAQ